MDWLTFLLSPVVREVGVGAILLFLVVAMFRGWIVPGPTHKRELAREQRIGDEHAAASAKKDSAIAALLQQNSNLLAGVRIADKFYRDFLPAVDEHTVNRSEVPDVRPE